jgi:predicted permease
LDQDIREHIERETDENIQRGMSPDDARRAALRKFGNVLRVKEDTRWVWIPRWFDEVRQDVRYALRALRRTPGFTAIAVLTLALGIGANTTIFTLLDAVVLAPLPVRAPHELFAFYENSKDGTPDQDGGTGPSLRFSYQRFERLQRALGSHGSLAAVTRSARLVEHAPGSAERRYVRAQLVSGGYFSTLGVTAARGRMLGEEDTRTDRESPVAVVTDRFWHQSLGGSAGVLGQSLIVNDVAVTIVGVAPPGFVGLWSDSEPDLWLPLTLQRPIRYATNYSTRGPFDVRQPWLSQDVTWLNLVARIPARDVQIVLPAMQVAYREGQLEQAGQIADPKDRESLLAHTLAAAPFAQGFSGLRRRYSTVLVALTAMAGLLLIVTCANIASLLLARATARGRDLAIRLSLGATTVRLVRQYLTESLAVALLGGIGGTALSQWTSAFLAREMLSGSPSLPVAFTPGPRVLAFAAAVTVVTAIAFGLAPAFRAIAAGKRATLAGNQRESVGHARTGGLQWLVAGQLALSLALVAAAACFGRTLVNFLRVDPGFAAERLLSVSFDPVSSGYSGDRLHTLARRLLTATATVPGVTSVSAATCGLIAGCSDSSSFQIEGLGSIARSLNENRVSAGYFATVGIPVVAGREFDERDTGHSQRVGILNETAVRAYFGGRNPIGRRIGTSALDTEIVGVVRDAHTQTLHEDPVPTAYFPLDQSTAAPGTLDVRVGAGVGEMEQAVREALRRAEPDLLIGAVTPMSTRIARDLARERLAALLAFGFAALTLLLAALGLYGMLSYGVAQRTQEIGVRMALGARRTEVLWLVGRQSAKLAALGIIGGIGTTVAASRYLSALLYGVSPLDPATLILVTLILTAVAFLASLLPARRAATVDPLIALRNQ